MTEMPPPPPGWYADPAGAHGSRWWDGSAWTEQVREAPPGDDPPPLPDDHVEARAGVLGRGRARVVGLVVLGVLAVALAATAAGLGVGPDGPTQRAARLPGAVAPDMEVPPPLDPADVQRRAEAAGCQTSVDGRPLADRTHLDPGRAPPAAVLYPQRPAHSGPHFGSLLSLPRGAATVPLDERAVLHNMEHGSVVVWFDDAGVSGDRRRTIAAWRDQRARLGFTSGAGGAVFASPMPDLDGGSVPGVALRAWGVAVDCDRFDPAVADAFLVEHWGDHGAAPEGERSPYPEDSLRMRERA